MKLEPGRQEQARTFLYSAARPLEQARYAYHFESGAAETVLARLARFQNPDGGFGHGLEPDLRTDASSAIATTVGLQILRDVQAPADQSLAQGAIRYLLASYDPQQQRWPIATAAAGTAPHAPWWEPDAGLEQRFGSFLANPRAELVGYLYDYADLVPAELRETLAQATAAYLQQLPDVMEMHDLLCFVRLAETRSLPEAVRSSIMPKLQRAVAATVARERDAWDEYSLQPLAVVSTPDSPFATLFEQELGANLDALIEQQQDDGSWRPSWSWDDSYPEAWAAAEQEWAGVLTLSNLRTLQRFDRLA